MIIYSTTSYTYLLERMMADKGYERGEVQRFPFPDGESYHRFLYDASDQDVVIVGGTISDQETLELFDMACGLAAQSIRRLIIVIPFFGYSTMERAVKLGEIVKAKHRALLLSSIPSGMLSNLFLMLDLHSEGIPHYFEGNIQCRHLYAKPIILGAVAQLGGPDAVLAAPDSGRAKWVESLAKDAKLDTAFVYKRRLTGNQTVITGINADVKGRNVIIYDDMIRTGGTLMKAAQAFKEAGATSVHAIATHILLPQDSLQRIQASGLIDGIVGTDSHPRSIELQGDFLRIESISSIFNNSIFSR
jgi:ribose-phosphate pyrophosphokinase